LYTCILIITVNGIDACLGVGLALQASCYLFKGPFTHTLRVAVLCCAIHQGHQKQVRVPLPTTADNVTLLAFAAERRAAERRAAAGRPAADAVDRHLLLAGPTAANPPQRRAAAE